MGHSMTVKLIFTYLSLSAFLLSVLSCNPVRSRELENPAQLPASQDNAEVRTSAPYVLDAGDEVTIRVWGYSFDEVQRSAVINNSGEIYFPMLGPVKLAGKTVPAARETIAAGLKKYYVDPQVELSTTASRQQVHVLGEVNNPGTFSFRRPLLLYEALAKARWFNLSANRQRVLLVRRANDQYQVFSVNTGDVFKDGTKAPSFYLQSGDIVYAMPTNITNMERFMQKIQNIMQPLLSLEQIIILGPQFVNAVKGKLILTPIAVP
jgi:protein involved in polysaccharide export with SLBB domain